MIPFLKKKYRIIDISQSVSSKTSQFPGDCPFSFNLNLEIKNCDTVNLTSFTMSPHVGTHVDAYSHIIGSTEDNYNNVGQMPLEPFIGEVLVLDLGQVYNEISFDLFLDKLNTFKTVPNRVLIKSSVNQNVTIFDKNFAYLTPSIVEELHKHEVVLVGTDSPSVDKFDSKDLPTHHKLIGYKMFWLENLNLTNINTGVYFLVAPPLKFIELEASPLRAVLLEFEED